MSRSNSNPSAVNINKQILSLFSGQGAVVTTPKLYIELTGSHSLAIVLSQCVFWCNKSSAKDGWFYKEYSEWFDEIHMPERTLRRKFEILEQAGWITTKIKKVHGVNTKHVHTNMDKIVESISFMLNQDCPGKPTWPSGSESVQFGIENEQKNCTKLAPTGQLDRSEPATLSDSYNETDDYLQIKQLTNCDSSSSFYFSETTDKSLVSQKLKRDVRSDDEFLKVCVDHVDNYSDKKFPRLQRANALVKLLKRLNESNSVFREGETMEKAAEDKSSMEDLALQREIAQEKAWLEKNKLRLGGQNYSPRLFKPAPASNPNHFKKLGDVLRGALHGNGG